MPAVRVRTIQTAVPETVIAQPRVRDLFAAQPGLSRLATRLVGASFDASGIDTRHTVIRDFAEGAAPGAFLAEGVLQAPGTAERNALYAEQSAALAVEAGRAALAATAREGITAADVTHVITVSCTGFVAPGPDYVLVRELGLAPSTQRFHVGFMGCYAVFPALRMARAFCEADPDAVVLIVSVELCTLHVRSSDDADQIVASSVFADGAAAAVVTAREPAHTPDAHTPDADTPDAATPPAPMLELDALETVLTPVGEGDMAWTIGDHGFEMVLSSYVPKIIDEHVTGALEPLLGPLLPHAAEAITHWAVHPGGRSILDRVQAKLELAPAQLAPSREVLRRYGNMSSATILFVLKELLERLGEDDEGHRVCAMAFGPGLTVETGLFTVRMAPPVRIAARAAASGTEPAEPIGRVG